MDAGETFKEGSQRKAADESVTPELFLGCVLFACGRAPGNESAGSRACYSMVTVTALDLKRPAATTTETSPLPASVRGRGPMFT